MVRGLEGAARELARARSVAGHLRPHLAGAVRFRAAAVVVMVMGTPRGWLKASRRARKGDRTEDELERGKGGWAEGPHAGGKTADPAHH